MTMTADTPAFTLSDGRKIPAIGFGTYPLKGSDAADTIRRAIAHGYRLIDSAYNYENEGALGEALSGAPVAREELFITSKLPGRYHAFDKALPAIEESLYRAKLDYFDLYLIHWPNPRQDRFVEAWAALIDARKRGLARSIGVSNFLPEHIERIVRETGVSPAVNQIEIHPHFPNAETVDWDREHGIVTEAWSPFARGREVFSHQEIQDIARVVGKTPAQVVLRWHFQRGCIAIPKASSDERQIENIRIFDFELAPDQMERITSLARQDGRYNSQDPAVYEEF